MATSCLLVAIQRHRLGWLVGKIQQITSAIQRPAILGKLGR
ncbi:hypothetical protein O999_12640 [Pseudomonas putida LF54]|nr:hypothetical protein O999_12640 [Pseudomonas putida LF54]